MIWTHSISTSVPLEYELRASECVFCGADLEELTDAPRMGPPLELLHSCPICGWWSFSLDTGPQLWERAAGATIGYSLHGAIAELRAFDTTDLSVPIEEIRQFLTARYEARFEIHPRVFEETVASVFRSLGYDARATAYSKDGGIDVVLESAEGSTVGIQVKRTKNPVEVDQIRSLAGALLQGGHTSGVFVTTSQFTSGSRDAEADFEARGLPVELVDAEAFFQKLGVVQRRAYRSYNEWSEKFGVPELQVVYEGQ